MPQPLLDFLVGRARQALPYMRALAARGTNAGVALEILQQFDLGFQKQRFLDVYAALQNRADVNRYARLVGPNGILPPEAHTVAVTELTSNGQPVNYQYLLEVENGPIQAPEYITVSSQVPLSTNDIFSLGTSILSNPARYSLTQEELGQITLSLQEANRQKA